MSIKLVREDDTYEVEYPQEGVEKDKAVVFVLRKLTAGKWNYIQDSIVLTHGTGRGGSSMKYLGGTATRMKIDYCLVNWRNVIDDSGVQVNCTSENKLNLPQDIQGWLEERIDEDNYLKGVSEDNRKK